MNKKIFEIDFKLRPLCQKYKNPHVEILAPLEYYEALKSDKFLHINKEYTKLYYKFIVFPTDSSIESFNFYYTVRNMYNNNISKKVQNYFNKVVENRTIKEIALEKENIYHAVFFSGNSENGRTYYSLYLDDI